MSASSTSALPSGAQSQSPIYLSTLTPVISGVVTLIANASGDFHQHPGTFSPGLPPNDDVSVTSETDLSGSLASLHLSSPASGQSEDVLCKSLAPN